MNIHTKKTTALGLYLPRETAEQSTLRCLVRSRKGGIVVLMALMLPILFLLAAFTINISYLQLTKTELMVATDASARAGGRAISYYQNIDDAKTAAQVTAALNNVAGQPLQVSFNDGDNEIEFGESETSDSSDRYQFTKVSTSSISSGSNAANAIRVTGKLTNDSLNGSINGIFPSMGLNNTFNLTSQAVAMQLDRDIALILDRSGSMDSINDNTFPYGYNPWSTSAMNAGVAEGILYTRYRNYRTYYYYSSGHNQVTYWNWLYTDHFNIGSEGPYETLWQSLVGAVDTFLTVLEGTDQSEQVSVATYASSARLDLNLVTDYDLVRSTLTGIDPNGATGIGYGLQTGMPSLMDSFARPFAAKTIILMTDGIHNTGTNPITAATSIASQYNVIIHTVTFGPGADQATMQSVANIGGGLHYHADTSEELLTVFEQIANNLPTLITQ